MSSGLWNAVEQLGPVPEEGRCSQFYVYCFVEEPTVCTSAASIVIIESSGDIESVTTKRHGRIFSDSITS